MSDRKRKADELLSEAYRAYYSDVYRFCMSILTVDKDGINDCVQEAYIVLYNKYLDGEEVEFVKAFLFKTAKNFVLKRVRELDKSYDFVNLEDVKELITDLNDIDEGLTFEEYNRQISAALSDRDALLFKLRYIDDYKIEEIADELNLSASAVGIGLHRLKKRLIKILEDVLSSD